MKIHHTPYSVDTSLEYVLGREDLTLDIMERLLTTQHTTFTLAPEAIERIQSCRAYLDQKVASSDRPLYGITTGFGSLCNVSISPDDLSALQANLVKSHSCSYGQPVALPIVKAMMILKVHALALGKSGVTLETVQCIVDMLNHEIYPVVYENGSLGASGDLAPLAKLFLPLIGEGEVYYHGEITESRKAFEAEGLHPIALKSKEGLALLNGTQFMSSHAVYALILSRRLLSAANTISALSLEAFDGLEAPFVEPLHTIRPHPGQLHTAKSMRTLLSGSQLQQQHKSQVQDPYSFRCIPQVHGAAYDTWCYVADVVTREINSVTDNPTIFPEEDMIVSGGNFHGEPLALVMDFLAIALSELGNISERRTAQLILGLRGLPEFLVASPGLNSGYMIPQYAAAAMVSKNKMYCCPASADSIVSSNGQEDHVSMGANAATKLFPLIENLIAIFGIELMNGAQALELRKGESKTSEALQELFRAFRTRVPFVVDDVVMYSLIEEAATFVYSYDFSALIQE